MKGRRNPSMKQVEEDQFNDDGESTCYESCLDGCGSCSGCLRSWLPCCCCMCPYPYQSVRQGSVGLKERFGRWTETLDPGLHYINPCTESMRNVSLLTTFKMNNVEFSIWTGKKSSPRITLLSILIPACTIVQSTLKWLITKLLTWSYLLRR